MSTSGSFLGDGLSGSMPTFSKGRALTSLPVSVRATLHSRGVKHKSQLAGEAAVKYLVSDYHMKWESALM